VTSGFLERILPEVRASLGAEYLAGLPDAPPHRPSSLRAALTATPGGSPSVMVEFKRRSPGRPDLGKASMPVSRFATLVRSTGARGASVLACKPEFDGSPETVAQVVVSTGRPVLFKDFVIDRVQLEAARRAGASAVLLIARLDTEGRLRDGLRPLAEEAHRLGLEVLLELHRPEELKLANRLPWDILGVNVRDLDTLRLEPGTALETLRAARGSSPLIAMSGIASAGEARPLVNAGATGLLVGTGFVRSRDPEQFVRTLRALHSAAAA